MIHVTKTFLPDLKDYVTYLEGIWERGQLTNHGPLVLEFEAKMRDYLGVKHFFFVNNGTVALQIAIKALNLSKDVITTPFSYVATTSSLVWENCNPVFADIDHQTLTVNAAAIDSVLTKNTTGILLTHVYGNPCKVEEVALLAEDKGLKVIYDAAHAFGVTYRNRSILNFGDISTLSFHATKLFHTIEGGGIVTNNDELAHTISYMRNFGHNGTEAFFGLGINGIASEFQAAMGLCILPHLPEIMERRKEISQTYLRQLRNLPLSFPVIQPGTSTYNYSYFPVIFESEDALLVTDAALRLNNIYPRRYFYPALNSLAYVTNNLKDDFASSVSKRILCLPLSPYLTDNQVVKISEIIKSALQTN
jgi:dTDP-4-amino-4,6-dideoxygalactose transaminase